MTTQTAEQLAQGIDECKFSLNDVHRAAAMLRSQAAEIERHRTNSDLQMQRAIRAEAEIERLRLALESTVGALRNRHGDTDESVEGYAIRDACAALEGK